MATSYHAIALLVLRVWCVSITRGVVELLLPNHHLNKTELDLSL